MNRETDNETWPATAAEWFIELESESVDQATEREFDDWLESDPEHEPALERCEAACQAAAELEQDPELRWAFAELESLERVASKNEAPRGSAVLAKAPGFAWIAASFAGLGLVLIMLAPHVARQSADADLQFQREALGESLLPQQLDDADRPIRGELLGNTLRPESRANPTLTVPAGSLLNSAIGRSSGSIAVLPFSATGSNPDARVLAVGLHQSILDQLRATRGLDVALRDVVLPFADTTRSLAEIARDLDVGTVIEGSIASADGRVQLSIQLFDASTNSRVWSETYDRPLANVFEAQAEIARSVAGIVAELLAATDAATGSTAMTNLGAKALLWVDQSGREQTLPFPARPYTSVRLSPDGQRIAVTVQDEGEELWLLDFVRETASRLTFGRPPARAPIWSPDGGMILFGSEGVGGGLVAVRADGSQLPFRLVASETGAGYIPSAISPNGQMVLYNMESQPSLDLLLASLGGTRINLRRGATLAPLIASPFNESQAAISPDGRWLAYTADDSGRPEVYVRPFPNVEAGRWQVSSGGGTEPLWSPDGERLYYRKNGRIDAVDIETSPTFSIGWSSPVVFARYASTPYGSSYDISPDGERFLVLLDTSATAAEASRQYRSVEVRE